MKKKFNILFVCRYNKFRSRVAEAYFNKVNKNKNWEAKSAGLIKGYDVEKNNVKLLKKEFNINIYGKTKGLNAKDISRQNITVIVADNVPKSVFNRNKKFGKKVIKFNIKDTSVKNTKMKIKITRKIIKKVDSLIKQLEKSK